MKKGKEGEKPKKALNYNNMVARFDRMIIFLQKSQMTRVTIYTHNEFLENLISEDVNSWLTKLKVCVELFTGEVKGLSDIQDVKELREQTVWDSITF